MRECDRCGERNHDAARYCGTCGQPLAAPDHQDHVDDDVAMASDDTTSERAPGVAGVQSSEYVSAPTFGETAVPVDPPTEPARSAVASTAVVSPQGGSPPQFPHAAHVVHGAGGQTGGDAGRSPGGSGTSGVMIAALAVAAVVIVGGAFILLAPGSGESGVTSPGVEATVPQTTETESPPTEPSATPAPTQPTASPTTPAAATTPPAPVSDPVAATTVPPEPAPTAPATTPPLTRGPGDLGLTQPILNEECDGRYITFVGSAVGDRPYDVVVDELLGLYPGANYVWTKACPSLRQEFTDGADIYGVVFGPYATQEEACNARAFGPGDAYVRRISTFDPQDHTITC